MHVVQFVLLFLLLVGSFVVMGYAFFVPGFEAIVFIVGLMISLFSVYRMGDLMSADSSVTMCAWLGRTPSSETMAMLSSKTLLTSTSASLSRSYSKMNRTFMPTPV